MTVLIEITDADLRALQDTLQVSAEDHHYAATSPDLCDEYAKRILAARIILKLTSWPIFDQQPQTPDLV